MVAAGFIDTYTHSGKKFNIKMAVMDGVTTGMDYEPGKTSPWFIWPFIGRLNEKGKEMTLREIVPYLRRWLITSLLCVFCFPAIAQQSLMEGPALNDLFSKTQAKHGSKIFASQCVHCHSDKKVRRFLFDRWSGKSLGGFYEHLRKTMPPENTGKLQPEDYLNVTAFLVVKQGFNTSDSDSDGEHEQWRNFVDVAPEREKSI